MAEESGPDNVRPFPHPGQFTGPPGGSGPNDPSVEARLARLEAGVDAIRLDLAEIKGKLSNLPTTVTLLGLVVAVLAAGFGMALAVAKLASGH
jgi:hypothetical protein